MKQKMFKKLWKSSVTLALAGLFTVACSSGATKTESDHSPSSVISQSTQTTVVDAQLAEVESDLASLDADLEVIDQAIADLDSIAP